MKPRQAHDSLLALKRPDPYVPPVYLLRHRFQPWNQRKNL